MEFKEEIDEVERARREYDENIKRFELEDQPPLEDAETALKRAFPVAVQTMIHLMKHEIKHPAVRLKAATYISERYLGPMKAHESDEFLKLIASLQGKDN